MEGEDEMKNEIVCFFVVLTVIFLGMMSNSAWAQWHTFTSLNSGLPNNKVRHLLTSEDGAIWIGTHANGLARYDGAWKAYSVETGELPANWISCLLEAKEGSIWVGTGIGGSDLYEEDVEVAGAEITISGGGWVAKSGGLARYKDGIWKTYSKETGELPDNWVTCLLESQDGSIWMLLAKSD